MHKKHVYGGFSQALFFSGTVSIPRFLLDHYIEMGISDREMLFVIHLLAETNYEEDVLANVITKMGISQQEFSVVLESLKKKNLLVVNNQKNKNKPITNRFDMSGLIDQLFELWGIHQFKQMEALENGNADGEKQQMSPTDVHSLHKLTTLFESELGRPLTGLECEHIQKWLIASYSEELITEALRRGVSAGIRSFRYLDTILREWEKKGIRTILEVEAEDQHFQSRQQKKTDRQKKATPKNKYDDIYL